MQNSLYRCVLVSASLLVSQTVIAQVVDQSNYVDRFHPISAVVAGGFTHFWAGQTFRPAASTSVGAGFNIRPYRPGGSGSSTLTIELWDNFPWFAGAVKLATGNTSFTLATDQISMVDVFWTSVPVTPGAMYFLAARAPNPAFDLTFTTSAFTDNYASGSFYWNQGVSSTAPYSGNSNLDAVFEEFAATPRTTVPEPRSAAFLAAGLFSIFVVNRRRRSLTS